MSSMIDVNKKPFIRNPYIIGIPINKRENFFGREELFQFIASVLGEGAKIVLLHGQRRIGKTSVLRQIPNFVGSYDLVFVTFDLQDQTRLSLGSVLFNLATEIAGQLSDELKGTVNIPGIEVLKEDPYVFTGSFLIEVFQALNGKRLVLLLDEFDVLSTYSDDTAVEHFFPFLNSIINPQIGLHVIAVVGRRLDEIPTLLSLFKGAPNQEIGLLDRIGAERLITIPTQNNLKYSQDAIDALLELSQCHPYFTQLLCHVTFASVRERNRDYVLRSDIEAIIDKAIVSGEAGLVWFREGLPIPERVIFSAIAESQEKKRSSEEPTASQQSPLIGPGVTKKELSSLLGEHGILHTEHLRLAEQRLLEWGFVTPSDITKGINVDGQSYRVSIELVRRWLLKRHDLRRAMHELDRMYPTAEIAYKNASNFVDQENQIAARSLFKKALEDNPNHIHAIFGLAQLELESGNFDEAVELFTRSYKIDSLRSKDGLVGALVGSGRDLLANGEFEQSLWRLEQAVELEPDDVSIMNQLEEAREQHRHALALRNPFIVGNVVPADQFVGRDKEIDTIFPQLLRGSHVAICGERRMGKTSLLRYLASAEVWNDRAFPIQEKVIINLDCASMLPFTPELFRREILLELYERTENTLNLSASIAELAETPSVSVRDLRRLLMSLGKRNISLVLLVDEFDVAFQPHENYSEAEIVSFVNELRSIAQSPEGQYFSSVIAMRRRPNELGFGLGSLTSMSGPSMSSTSLPSSTSLLASPWYNYYFLVLLKPFEESDVQSLVAKMPQSFALGDEELSWVRHIAGGHPFLLQAELSILFRLHAEDKKFVMEHATKELLTLVESLFLTLWSGASEIERVLLSLIALRTYEERKGTGSFVFKDYDVVFNQSERELRELEERSILVRQTQGSSYRYAFFSPLMTWWIIKEIEARSDDEIVLQMETFSNFINHVRANQLLNLLLDVQVKKPAYHDMKSWVS